MPPATAMYESATRLWARVMRLVALMVSESLHRSGGVWVRGREEKVERGKGCLQQVSILLACGTLTVVCRW